DRAGQEQTQRIVRQVDAQPFRYTAIPENGMLVPGVPNAIYVYAYTIDGAPARVKGTVTVGDDVYPIATGELGAAAFTFTPTNGQFALKFDLTDERGQRVATTVLMQPGPAADDFLVRTDKAVYTAGETMHLTGLGGRGSIFLDFLKDDQTVRSDVIDVANGRG